jgi:hypothetical protein
MKTGEPVIMENSKMIMKMKEQLKLNTTCVLRTKVVHIRLVKVT